MRHPASAYRQFSVQSATPLGLVVMLYDGAITFMQRALAAIETHDISNKCAHLNSAQAIILQLEGTLNFERGGEVAQTLKTLYLHVRAQMLRANIENSPEILRSLIEKLTTVRDAWHEADHRPSDSVASTASETSHQEIRYDVQPGQQTSPSAPARNASPYAYSPTLEPGSLRLTG